MRHLRTLLGTCALVLALHGEASAHAVLEHSTPHRNSAVREAPASVQLDFNEPVEVGFGAVRVYDEQGARVDRGKVSHPAGRSESVVIGLRAGLGRGAYTTTYRVVSADGHPVSGGFVFGVGARADVARATPKVADLLARSAAGATVEGGYGAARGLHYAALLILVGAVFFRWLVWPPGRGVRLPRRLLAVVALTGLVASLAGVVFQGALGAGLSLGDALDREVIDASLDTRTGEAWLVRAVLWAVVLAGLAVGRAPVAWLGVTAAALVATLPYAGHASTQSPRGLLVVADVVHVLAAGAWLGGLVVLLACFWPRRATGPVDGAAQATGRFSRMALPAIVVLVVAGTAQAWFLLGSVGELLHGTYGLALSAKIFGLLAIVAVAARSRRLAGGRPSDGRALRRAMSGEVALAVLVLAATATLVRAAPPATLQAGPVVRELDLGPIRLHMSIEPGEVGPNDYHLYLFDSRTGEQIDRVEELRIRLVQRDKGIGPLTMRIPRKGPAHYELRNSMLGVAGDWEGTVTARVSEFDEYSARTRFEVRRP